MDDVIIIIIIIILIIIDRLAFWSLPLLAMQIDPSRDCLGFSSVKVDLCMQGFQIGQQLAPMVLLFAAVDS